MTSTPALTAAAFVACLEAMRSPERAAHARRYFRTGGGEDDGFLGVPMSRVVPLAREFVEMPLGEIERLLESPLHEARAGAVTIMDLQAGKKRLPQEQRKALFELYLRRHDRINHWDLVDRAAKRVVGRYLEDRPRDVLYRLARSPSLWERRSSIVATAWFVAQGELDDTFAIAELLVADQEDLIHKAAGWWLREAGMRDRARLREFLDRHAATMPRVMLRYAIEHLPPAERADYLGKKARAAGGSPHGSAR